MNRRIEDHPILSPLPEPTVQFTFNGTQLLARPGEMISSALYAAGITAFGRHHKDGGAQGIFCVNGQCSQCTVLVDGRPLKSCMTRVEQGMEVSSCDGRPALPAHDAAAKLGRPGEHLTQVLVLGGGPAGLCAAVELGRLGVRVLIVDDKPALGGKLTLQTHQFFGSVADCWAGTRGIDIGGILERQVSELPTVDFWLDSTAVGIFRDGKVGVVTPAGYRLVEFDSLLVSLGAREKSLSFPGCDLPGVYGAGAFQTLVNRDLVRSSSRLFVVGGGNVGLIAAYHALQAGIDVVGLVEALPEVGGYKVHADKIKRLGVPIWTSHTVVRAVPDESGQLRSVTIARIDDKFRPVDGSERTFGVDTLLIAVGLNSCDELLGKAEEIGIKAYAAGDTAEIAEASAAIFSGRIIGRQIANDMGIPVPIPEHWPGLAELLRSRPGAIEPFQAEDLPDRAVFPLIRCVQEIPCDPCREACPEGLISLDGSIMGLPRFEGTCLGCGNCVTVCPGLAINLVFNDYDESGEKALLMIPFEFSLDRAPLGHEVNTVDMEGNPVGKGRVVAVRERPEQDRRHLLLLEVPASDKLEVAGFTIRGPSAPLATAPSDDQFEEDPIVCRCERVRKSEILDEIRAGVRDLNQLKALARSGMGGCGGKTCTELVGRIFREEGIVPGDVTPGTVRPLVAETPLDAFIRGEEERYDDD